jgi:hypothetical protein
MTIKLSTCFNLLEGYLIRHVGYADVKERQLSFKNIAHNQVKLLLKWAEAGFGQDGADYDDGTRLTFP